MEDDRYNPEENYIIEGSIFEYRSPQGETFPPGSPLERFSRLAQLPDEEIDLAETALLIAAQEYDGLDESYYLDRLDDLADEVRPLIVTQTDPLKNIENLNYFLNKQQGFHGNETEYNDRRNSYLNDVLENKTGIPISLSLLYIELGKRLGLHFEGIGLPGHFIIRYRELAPQTVSRDDWLSATSDNLAQYDLDRPSGSGGRGEILLDPFNGGTILTEEDCVELVRERYGRVVPIRQAFLRPVTNRQFITRMLYNLRASCTNDQDFERALEIQECLLMLHPSSPEEHRDRGLLYLKEGRYGRAISDLRFYLRHSPDAPDAEAVRKQLSIAFDGMVQRN